MMRTSAVFLAAMMLVLTAGPAWGDLKDDQRPHDPWVFRCVLDENPRVVVAALHENLWAAYDARNGGLVRTWRDGVNFTGPVYDTRHGPQPESIGEPIMEGPDGDVWQVRRGGRVVDADVIWRGYRFDGDRVTLRFALQLSGGEEILIDESPEVDDPDADAPGLERVFTMRHAPDGVDVRLMLYEGDEATYRALDVKSTAGLVHRRRPEAADGEDRLTVMASLRRNATTTITINSDEESEQSE